MCCNMCPCCRRIYKKYDYVDCYHCSLLKYKYDDIHSKYIYFCRCKHKQLCGCKQCLKVECVLL